jgi:hypothetical protein
MRLFTSEETLSELEDCSLYDRAGAGSFGTFQGMISASYIKSMGRRDNHQLSAGIQVGYTQLRLNQNDLKWANQYNGANQFDGNTASNVSLQPNVGYVNFNAGLLYYGKFSERFSMYLGGAFYNAATMKYNLEANSTKRNLYYRYNCSSRTGYWIRKIPPPPVRFIHATSKGRPIEHRTWIWI